MFKNSNTAAVNLMSAGFSLLEFQIYLGLMAILVVMVCQVALMYHNLYDKIALSAQHSVNVLTAIFQVNETFDHAVAYKKNHETFSNGLVFKKNKLMGIISKRQSLILDEVSHFSSSSDMFGKQVRGASFTCDYKTKHMTWYRAAFTKAFSCSLSL
ncbi:MAG: hypothetical protein K2X90_03545 [Candidatus Babeliaceae bacterium]|nr:hypothetical protein [Candidatus Babeliaceae bacterium]